MSRTCTVCNHPERQAIEQALIDAVPFRDIAGRFRLSKSALERHKRDHLPVALTQAKQAAAVAQGDNLLARIEALQAKTLAILSKADARGEDALALKAVAEARRNLELLAELTHELDRSPQVNLLLSPDWQRLRLVILNALMPYPEARARVAAALLEVEHEPGA